MTTDSYPYLHLVRRLCLPYATVLLCAESACETRDDILTRKAMRQVNRSDLDAIKAIHRAEMDRRCRVSRERFERREKMEAALSSLREQGIKPSMSAEEFMDLWI